MKNFLIDQFTKCYDDNGWFVTVRNAIDGLTAAEAAWTPEGADNSVWKTLSHLTYYNYAYLERFKGIDYEYDVADNDATFTADRDASEEAWSQEVERFDAVMNEFRELLKNADATKFDQPVSATNQKTWGTLVASINAHNAYHAGQVLILRKLQGSWDRAKGVS